MNTSVVNISPLKAIYETVVFVVIPHEVDLIQNNHVHSGSECDFQSAMHLAVGKTDDMRLTVVDAVTLTKLIVTHDHSHVSYHIM
jgi:hypothetical protein